ncbi:recombinase family protein [Noviluteimonas gilva]|uniref:Resolvase n=1 Tax=Noviluteimonas gilva TaxID=2682097 RepID=A0A7C9HTC1_9GAMM|nr:recombinase family protein [Lysobacter gilvus]MUV14693.1 resolvase [Lysobacter gilvus]
MKYVGYLRVSTARQGHSGLGLDAQRLAIEALVEQRGGKAPEIFVEIESGKVNNRPELSKALHLTKVTGATLVIARLDRLSRNAAFLLTLQDSGARFVAADMPDANHLTVGIMALVAQQEREAISKRTKEALQAAKARGQKLGNPNGAQALRRAARGNTAAIEAVKATADSHAAALLPVLRELRANGCTTLSSLAKQLNERGVLAPRGGTWHRSSVANLIARAR